MLTVLIATHNGADTLGRALEQFCALRSPPGGWKLLVVNNASTDRTAELVLGFGDRLPLDYLFEARLGKPYALNTGIEHISGDLVVFADDDVLPDPDWLVAWRSAVDRQSEYSIFGGTIEPFYERDPPEWLSKFAWWEAALFARTAPRPEGPIPPTGCIFGPNMAVRTAALADSGFDERFLVGPGGLMGEDTEFVHRLAAKGNKTCFVPSARVRHIVHSHQFAWQWMLRRFYRHGRALFALEMQQSEGGIPEVFPVPRWRIRQMITSAVMVPITLLSCDRVRIFAHLQAVASNLGVIAQALNFYRNPERWRSRSPDARGGTAGSAASPAQVERRPTVDRS